MTAPKIETTTLVQLDERTKEELQPPCDISWFGIPDRCPRPAKWLMVTRCPVCGPRPAKLHCDEHLTLTLTAVVCCTSCGDRHLAAVIRVEPLR